MIKLIAFDLDDTLWANGSLLDKAEDSWYQWLAINAPKIVACFSPLQLKQLRHKLVQPQLPYGEQVTHIRYQCALIAAQRAGYNIDDSIVIAKIATEAFIAFRSSATPALEVEQHLSYLSNKCELVAITNGNTDIAQTPLQPYFGLCLHAEQFSAAKPDPRMLKWCEQHFNVTASECLMVGDSMKYDGGAAALSGWHFTQVYINEQEANQPLAPVISKIQHL